MTATQAFVDRHYPTYDRGDRGNRMSSVQSTQWAMRTTQQALAKDEPGDAGPCHRNASKDDRRRHLAWLQSMAYLRGLAEYRGQRMA